MAFTIWMLQSYFNTIPKDLEEAAWIDGATPLESLLRVFLPLAVPAMAVTAIFTFINSWNEFVLALTMIRSSDQYTLPVQISYRDNPRAALALLLKAADGHPRVLHEPAPASRVIKFDDNGILLELRFWIQDPEDGINNVRSDLHLAVWDLFSEAGITIPFPQRDVHMK